MPRSTNLPFERLILFILTAVVVSCNGPDWESTGSGLKYRILREGEGKSFINGHYLYLDLAFHDEKDSLLFTTSENGIPETLQILDTAWDRRGQLFEGLKKLKVGDSAVFKVNCEDLYLVSLMDPIPDGVDPESEITVYLGVKNMATAEEFRIWQTNLFAERHKEMQFRSERQRYADMAEIDEYLELNGIVPQEHESGIRYVINRAGEGSPPGYGDRVLIHYAGELTDGTRLGSSYDHQTPVEFIVGSGTVIPGWEIGVRLMNQGASYTFWLPSGLAYGERNAGGLIEPNSNLVYTIDLLEIQRKED